MEQSVTTRAIKGPEPPPLTIPTWSGDGIIGAPPVQRARPPPLPPPPASPKVTFPPPTPLASVGESSGANTESGSEENRRGWMPKMYFPRFDGTDVRI